MGFLFSNHPNFKGNGFFEYQRGNFARKEGAAAKGRDRLSTPGSRSTIDTLEIRKSRNRYLAERVGFAAKRSLRFATCRLAMAPATRLATRHAYACRSTLGSNPTPTNNDFFYTPFRR